MKKYYRIKLLNKKRIIQFYNQNSLLKILKILNHNVCYYLKSMITILTNERDNYSIY